MTTTLDTLATPRTWLGLAVLLLSALLTSMDISILFVAAPSIAEALDPTATQWLWSLDIYGFVMAGLLITMGSLGDRIGRKRLLLIGATLFGAASAVVAFAPTPELLIIARALLGIGGATLAPSTLSLIRAMFADERQRRTAVGAWTVAFSGGAVAGPIVGGLLLEHFWWGSVFLINVPVMLVLLASAPFLLPEAKDPAGSRFDIPGAAMSLVAMLGLVFAIKHIAEHGFDGVAVATLVLGLSFLLLFVRRQRRVLHPLIDVTLFRIRAFAAAVGANTVIALSAAGLGVLAFTFMQTVHGLSPFEAALWALPTFAGSLLGATAATTLATRISSSSLLTAGLVLTATGFGVVASVQPQTGLWVFIGGYTVLTFGLGTTGTIANSLILTTAPADRAGAAAGISETSNELGAALGIAVLGTIATTSYRSTMTETTPAGTEVAEPGSAATETVTGAVGTAERMADDAAAGVLLDAAFIAYTNGVNTAALITAALALIMAAVIVAVFRTASDR